MAGSNLFALIDDIATLLDDVAAMSKVAAKKTAGVLGDDLALNAEQVTGVEVNRELAVVWAVAKGSLLNKFILVPAALAISALLPAAITVLLMLGGLFLCYEGFEKLAHKFTHRGNQAEDEKLHEELKAAVNSPEVDLVAFEKNKIRGAIRTDFVLSAEIIVITLGSVADADFIRRVGVLVTIAILMTVGVYGLVAGIVKMDDVGLYLKRLSGSSLSRKSLRALGQGLLTLAPLLMKFLSVAGTAAMFMVGGGILAHGLEVVHEGIEHIAASMASIPSFGAILGGLSSSLLQALVGVIAGAITLALVTLLSRLKPKAATGEPPAA